MYRIFCTENGSNILYIALIVGPPTLDQGPPIKVIRTNYIVTFYFKIIKDIGGESVLNTMPCKLSRQTRASSKSEISSYELNTLIANIRIAC